MEEHRPKKLLDQVRDAIRLKHYSIRTEQAYVNWIKRYIHFHNVRHPAEMGAPQVQAREASPTWPWRKMSPPHLTHLFLPGQHPCLGQSTLCALVHLSPSTPRPL